MVYNGKNYKEVLLQIMKHFKKDSKNILTGGKRLKMKFFYSIRGAFSSKFFLLKFVNIEVFIKN
jgi:hypothetical protein